MRWKEKLKFEPSKNTKKTKKKNEIEKWKKKNPTRNVTKRSEMKRMNWKKETSENKFLFLHRVCNTNLLNWKEITTIEVQISESRLVGIC